MTISYNWLLDYLPGPLPLAELTDILTSIGLEVEGTESFGGEQENLAGLLVGEVLTVAQHPGADRLKLTTVNVGTGDPLSIVCGAPNVAAGQRVVVAPVGSTIHPSGKEPFVIREAVIRGQKSEGMLCSGDEIGLNDDHSGIMVLPAGAPVGAAVSDILQTTPADTAIHIGLTPNRTDAMSHLGVARDVCAYLTHHRGGPYEVRQPAPTLPGFAETDLKEDFQISIEAPEACPLYTGLSLKDVQVGPSPEWMQARLRTIGLRPINNVVDATNYVLHEMGQPLHAFDAAKISGAHIHVKFLPEGTPFKTLDGTGRTLRATDLMICDDSGGLCIAGVFGGEGSGVKDSTTSIFLESAVFDAATIRRTSLHHGLRTDAATRFEKGVSTDAVVPALRRAASLVLAMAGGSVASSVLQKGDGKGEAVRIPVSYSYINRLSGKDYNPAAVKNILSALHLATEEMGPDAVEVTIPGGRPHMDTAADVVEEILRIDGLDAVPVPSRASYTRSVPRLSDRRQRDQAATFLAGAGFSEILTNSIVNSRQYSDEPNLVLLRNSLSQELDAMRPRMLESGLAVVAHNVARRQADLLFFEIGTVYYTGAGAGAYREEKRLALWCTGQQRMASWNGAAHPADVFFLKGVIAGLARRFGLPQLRDEISGDGVKWMLGKDEIGWCKSVGKPVLSQAGIDAPVAAAEVAWDCWVEAAAGQSVTVQELPKAPAVERDLAIVLDASVSYAQLEAAYAGLGIPSLQNARLFDVFESEKLGAGKKSLALRFTFSGGDRTLTDAEVEGWMQQLIDAYRQALNAEVRSA